MCMSYTVISLAVYAVSAVNNRVGNPEYLLLIMPGAAGAQNAIDTARIIPTVCQFSWFYVEQG